MSKTFVGFGFGPIQSGLFVYEAFRSGNFSRLVVSEVDAELVSAVRADGNRCTVNIARSDGVEQTVIEGVELYNPRDPGDRRAIVQAVAESDEMATSLPSVKFYDTGGQTSVSAILAEGLAARSSPAPTVIYAAENHNHAAEILRATLDQHAPAEALDKVQVLNTVIGKMSGVITEPEVIQRLGLKCLAGGVKRAVLVEAFNRILVSRVALANYRRGIEVFQEKPDLLPFEEAKLYGHNAIHALIAYLADMRGLATIADAGGDGRIMGIAREAFINESGQALIRRHAALGDELFTPEGYRRYAEDLLERMVCPNLNDLVSRVGRDHLRKLDYDDRLYGTMNLALKNGVEPRNLALGAAAGVMSMIRRRAELPAVPENLPASVKELTRERLERLLTGLWDGKADENAERLVAMTWRAVEALTSF